MFTAPFKTSVSAASKFSAALDGAVGTVKTLSTMSAPSVRVIHASHRSGFIGGTVSTVRVVRRLSTIKKSPVVTRTADNLSSAGSSSPLDLAYISYEVKVHDENERRKSPLIVQHGLFGCKENWKKVAKEINFISRRSVFSVDGRNHGESPNTSEMSLNLMSSDLANFARSQSLEKVSLMGHNFGGRVAMTTALMYPGLVRKLVVVDGTPLMTPDVALRHSTILKAAAVLKNMTPELKSLTGYSRASAAAKAISGILKDKRDVAVVLSNLVPAHVERDEDLWRVNLDSILSNPYLIEFPNFKSTTFDGRCLFIQGEHSRHVRPGDEDKIRQLFPRAEFAWLEDCGSFMHVEKHEIFVKTLFQFLDGKHVLKKKEETK